MNILILNWRDPKNPKSGGAETVTLEHAKAWIKKGHKVIWFTSNFPGAKDKESFEGINIVRRGNFLTVFLMAPFFYFLSKNKFDLVIDEIHGIPFFTPLYVRRPKIAFIHEVANEIWDYMYYFPINKIGKAIEPILLSPYKKTKFITVSNSTKASLIKVGIKSENISVINNGIKQRDSKYLPDKQKIPTFIFVSRVVRMKGVEEVIKSFFYILKEFKDANLWIVGDGDKKYIQYLKKTMHLYAISTKIKFFGFVSEKTKLHLMSKAHILLHASVKEGWGLVVVEAASCGTPSIVYNVAGLRDSVLDNKTGVVLKKNSPQEMALEAISLYNDKQRYALYKKNSQFWAKSLTWEKATRQSQLLIEKVAQD